MKKKYLIQYPISLLRGKNKIIEFTGTYPEAQAYASQYARENRITVNQVFIREV